MSPSYALSFEITPTVVQEAAQVHAAAVIVRFRAAMVLIVVVGIGLAFVNVTLGVAVATFGILMLASTWVRFLDRWRYAKSGRGVMGGTCEYLVDDRGLHYRTPLSSGDMPWSALTTVRANDRSIVFARDRVMAAYIPTVVFASPAERESFLAFARERIGGAGEGATPG